MLNEGKGLILCHIRQVTLDDVEVEPNFIPKEIIDGEDIKERINKESSSESLHKIETISAKKNIAFIKSVGTRSKLCYNSMKLIERINEAKGISYIELYQTLSEKN